MTVDTALSDSVITHPFVSDDNSATAPISFSAYICVLHSGILPRSITNYFL
jgi:hypothetical protein